MIYSYPLSTRSSDSMSRGLTQIPNMIASTSRVLLRPARVTSPARAAFSVCLALHTLVRHLFKAIERTLRSREADLHQTTNPASNSRRQVRVELLRDVEGLGKACKFALYCLYVRSEADFATTLFLASPTT